MKLPQWVRVTAREVWNQFNGAGDQKGLDRRERDYEVGWRFMVKVLGL